MKKIFYAVFFISAVIISTLVSLFFGVGVVFAETQISADISTDATWGVIGSPYIVNGNVQVPEGATLNIDPGVVVEFTNNANGQKGSLTVLGSVHSNGTSALPINFSPATADQDWNVSFINSTSTLSYVTVAGSSQAIFGMNSNLKIDHLTATNLTGPAVMFNNSVADISASDFGHGAVMLETFNQGVVTVRDSTFHDVADRVGAVAAYGNSSLALQNVTIKNMTRGDGLAVYTGANVTVSSSTISNGVGNGVSAHDDGVISLVDTKIDGFTQSGIDAYSNAHVLLEHSLVTNNDNGLEIDTPTAFSATSSDIYGNKTYGVANYSRSSIDATNVWWGDVTGPNRDIDNATGTGNAVSNDVVIAPWLSEDPLVTPTCCSNVAFIPGLEGSRLYAPGLLLENKLWEPNRNADAEKLYLNASGASVRNDVYTRDVVGYVGIPLLNYDIYSEFDDYMDGLVKNKIINAWKPLPYDWRLGLSDVVNGGVEDANDNISYLGSTSPQISYMILSLSQLSHTAKNGKVTLVTHSNGGLVAKVLIQKLQDMKAKGQSDLIDHIDRVIMIAAPQLGAVEAVASLLHGYDLKYLGGLVLDPSYGRVLAENMPGAYNMLPSQKYFNQIKEPIISFATSSDSLNNFSKFYGRTITDYATLKKFLTGADGRKDPVFGDIEDPNVLNKSLLANAETQHKVIDNWQFPSSINVIQVAGWGLQTLKGIQYAGPSCDAKIAGASGCDPGLTMNPVFSVEGDGTVLYPSATESQGKQLYFDVGKYNDSTAFWQYNAKHERLLETGSIQDLVKDILIGTSTLPQYITSTKPTTKAGKLLVSITASTTISAKDSVGRHTGPITNPDPNSDMQVVEQNVPNSFYADFGGTKYVGVDASSPTPAKITFQGGGYGTFTVQSVVTHGDDPVSVSIFTDIPETPQMQGEILDATSSTPVLAIDVDGDGIIDSTTTPTQSFDPILYLEIMKKTVDSFNLKKAAEKTLMAKLDQLENLIKKGKIKNADKQIQKFIKKIDRKNNRLRKVSDDERSQIVQMLSDLVNNLI